MKLFSKYDRFDLEQDIIKMWNAAELLKEFTRQFMDSPKIMDEDEIANYIDGIMRVHELQCERLWNGFEIMVKNGHFSKWDEEFLDKLKIDVPGKITIKPKKASKK
jgi:hypothetical protein